MQLSWRWGALAVVALGASACGGSSTSDGSAGAGGSAGFSQGTGGSGNTGGTAGTGGSAGMGGTAGAAGAAGSAGAAGAGGTCVPNPDPPPFAQPTCADLDHLTVTNAYVESDLAPGTQVLLHVTLNEVIGEAFNYYPGVVVESDDPGVTASDGNWLFAILACQSTDVPIQLTVAKSLTPGTVVTLTAKVAMLNQDCPGTDSTKLTLTVK